jgi:hypothetical protein
MLQTSECPSFTQTLKNADRIESRKDGETRRNAQHSYHFWASDGILENPWNSTVLKTSIGIWTRPASLKLSKYIQ